MLLFGADVALIRRAAPATFSRKREKGFAPFPPIARREMGVFRRPMAPREDASMPGVKAALRCRLGARGETAHIRVGPADNRPREGRRG